MFKELKEKHSALIAALSGDDEKAISTAQAAYDKALVDASSAMDTKLETAMNETDQRVIDLTAKVKTLEEDAITLNADLTEAKKISDDSLATVKGLNEKVEGFETQVSTLEGERDDFKTKVDELTAANTKLSEKSGEKPKEVNNRTREEDVIGKIETADDIWNKHIIDAKEKAEQN